MTRHAGQPRARMREEVLQSIAGAVLMGGVWGLIFLIWALLSV